jgi:hypothetical protein
MDERLRDLGSHLDTGPAPDVATAVLARIRTEPTPLAVRARRRLVRLVAAVLAAVLAAGLLAVPAVRAAVVDLLSLPGVVFERSSPQPPRPSATPAPGPLGTAYQLTGRIPLASARRDAPERTLVPGRFGEPDEVYVSGAGDDQAVHLLWRSRPGLAALPGSGTGLYVSVFGNQAEVYLQKMLGGVPTVDVDVDGRRGIWIGAEHGTLLFGDDGLPDFSTRRLAGPTLLVDYGRFTVRIESTLPKDDVLDLAGSLR